MTKNPDPAERAAALVDSMESAFGVPHTRPARRNIYAWGGEIVKTVLDGEVPCPPPDLDEKIEATKKALQ